MYLFIQNILKTTFLNIKANKQVFVMSVITICIAFSILGLLLLVFVNLNTLFSTWDKQVQLIVYLKDDISKSQLSNLNKIYSNHEHIDSVSFVSKDIAWKKFKNTFSKNSEFIETLDFNPLPASYVLKFNDNPDKLNNIRNISRILKIQEGVEALEYGEKWISRFESFMVFLKVFILGIGGLICGGLVLIISNTIKLSIYSRKDEIELMAMLGATLRFIRMPLLIEGLIQGVTGVFIALVIVKSIFFYVQFHFQGSLGSIFRGLGIQYLTNSLISAMVIAGICVALVGSSISINQFLNTSKGR